MDPAVAAAFATLPGRLLAVRALIFETAVQTGTGPLAETLKWCQPAYQTAQTKSGTTLRLGLLTRADPRPALLVPCQTRVIDTCREQVPDLAYAGTRAVLIPPDGPLPEAALRRCIALGLTYNRWKG